ncbi:MAG TPA: hypothetical protein VGG03_02930 [Thermoanaerobaculia bacterium]|jgi:hypothetical protein
MKGRLIRAFAFLAALSLSVIAAQAQSGWTFQGCWAQFSGSTCYDVYTDSTGNYWRCAPCGTTKKPSSRTCIRITPSTGRWCS